MKPAIESRTQAFTRVINRIRRYLEVDTVEAMQAILEAKEKELWKEKYSSWVECCEKEFGKSRTRVHQLLELAQTIRDILSVHPVNASDPENKGILTNLTYRQAHELKGLEPAKKVEVLAQAVKASGGKSPKPEVIATARKSSGPCSEFGNGTYNGHAMTDFYSSEPRMHTTPEDTELAEEFAAYPKTLDFKVTLQNEQQESRLRALLAEIKTANGQAEPASKTPTRDLIVALGKAYKETTGKVIRPSGADAGQAKRFVKINGTDCFPEVIETFKKGLTAKDGFYSKQCHQLSSFFKFYGHIRNEVDQDSGIEKGQIKETIHVRSL